MSLSHYWNSRNFVAYALSPLALLYRGIVTARRYLYGKGIKKITRFAVPVIVVGNITTGGTGKTPLVSWLANFLQQQGFKPGIVSRGYGGKAIDYPQTVQADSDPCQVGDEAILLARSTQCPMVVDPNRVAAVTKLLTDHDCNIVICDDGLQHYALARTLEIAVIDAQRGLGNQFCLPAGPLREPIKRLAEVDFVVFNGGNDLTTTNMRLLPQYFCQLNAPTKNTAVENFNNKVVHAVAGIGNPSRFFQTLRNLGLTIIEHPFADHHPFKVNDFNFAQATDVIIMTEKDAVKCESFADERYWYLPVVAELSDGFGAELLAKLNVR